VPPGSASVSRAPEHGMGVAMRTLGTAVLAFALLAGCAVPVAAGLDEPDANKVVVALDQAGVDAVKDADPQVEG
jgi:type III secretory pathway lipoprotein EscJ